MLLLWGLLGVATQVVGQGQAEREYLRETLQKPDVESVWAGVGEGLDYTEAPQRRRPREATPPAESNGADWDMDRWDGSLFSEGTREVLRVLLFVLVIGLLTYFGYRLLGGIQPNAKRSPTSEDLHVEVERLATQLQSMDLDDFVSRALAQADYRLAIRLYFLQVLQTLADQKHIKWKKDKTNRQYLQELRDHPERDEVQRLTLLFERAWYGGGAVDAEAFQRAEAQFKPLLQRLKRP